MDLVLPEQNRDKTAVSVVQAAKFPLIAGARYVCSTFTD
jgi:hypothetical protein